jgi:hypothetical protein
MLAGVWARGRLRDLEDRYVVAGNAALEKEIVAVSLRFGVLCRFTAFVAVDRGEVVNEGGWLHAVVQPVEQPSGWAHSNALARAFPPPPQSPPVCAAPASAPEAAATGLGALRFGFVQKLKPGADMVTMGKLPQTPAAKQALQDAIEEARNLNHDCVDTEHLLLGLLRGQDGGPEPLRNLGLDLEGVRKEVQAEYARLRKPAGSGALTSASGYSGFTDQARRVMQLANQEAQRFNHEYIGVDHLLLALLSQETGVAADILKRRLPAPGDRLPFAARLERLLQEMRAVAAAAREAWLRGCLGQLEELVKEASASGLSQEGKRRLEEARDRVKALAATAPADEADVAEAWALLEAALSDGLAELTPDAARRKSFWK